MARLALGALALLLAATPVTPAEAVDLIGTWHVLTHYKDSSAEHPERERALWRRVEPKDPKVREYWSQTRGSS